MAESNNIYNNQLLARQFLNATVEKWGTDEEIIEQILKSVHDSGSKDDFETAVFQEIDREKAKKFGTSFSPTKLIPAILKDEMRGSQLARALDLYEKGEDSYYANRTDYFLEGLAAPLDLSSTGSKVILVAGVAVFAGLYVISAPVASVVGGAFLIGTAIYGAGKFIKNWVEILDTNSEIEVKENLRDLGTATTLMAMSAASYYLPKTIRAFRAPSPQPSNVVPIAIHPRYRPPLVESAQAMIRHEAEVIATQPGTSGTSARVYALGNTVAVAEAVPAPVMYLNHRVGAIHELPLQTTALWSTVGIAASNALAIPTILTDSEPLFIDVTDPENSKRRQELIRQLQRLQDQKKQIEELLGYCLFIPELDLQIEGLQHQLQELQSTHGANIMAVGIGSLRPYQEVMLSNLEEDLKIKAAPWLGIASPMQTGKSAMIPEIISRTEDISGNDTQFIILSSARIITAQLMKDLVGELGAEEVGRLDGLVKDPKRITVASIYTLFRREQLKSFPRNGKKLVIVMDEAYFTQTPIVRDILSYFGVGAEVSSGKRTVLMPKLSPSSTLIGLSGTGSGLGGYYLSGQLDLLNAVEGGWVRDMVGERVFPDTISTQAMRSADEGMIWWKATEENARKLVDIYEEKIQGKYQKNLIYVPTIEHGEFLLGEFQRRYGDSSARFVHSKLAPEKIEAAVNQWQQKGGILISVRMLSHGFRGTGTGAVMHTYQTSSEELFSQRTGRAWGVEEEKEYPPLYVLEVTWDVEKFSNLARLLGLVDYPRNRLETKGIKTTVEKIRRQQKLEEELEEAIDHEQASPMFRGIPLVEGWRERFQAILQQTNLS